MYRKLRSEFGDRDLGDRVLSISYSRMLCGLLGAHEKAIVQANYPEQSINHLNFSSESFSAVFSDQVLEHIECTPEEAVNEVHRVLRPGGLAIHTTCFLIPYHGSGDFEDLNNGDFWRFTPNDALPQTDETCRGGSDRRFMTSSGINQSHWDRSTA
jgi:ubiquinone/menaquinone biosynthesis C-methylase UbiE